MYIIKTFSTKTETVVVMTTQKEYRLLCVMI